mmetsp:Transcript_26934/g.89378  ORF Transcript_26934/g.89378 Transcript_26934/m.89378 type:complete len:107 (-) Transcript_26934:111-431(-)
MADGSPGASMSASSTSASSDCGDAAPQGGKPPGDVEEEGCEGGEIDSPVDGADIARWSLAAELRRRRRSVAASRGLAEPTLSLAMSPLWKKRQQNEDDSPKDRVLL